MPHRAGMHVPIVPSVAAATTGVLDILVRAPPQNPRPNHFYRCEGLTTFTCDEKNPDILVRAPPLHRRPRPAIAYLDMAFIATADIGMTPCSYGLCSYGLYSYGL